MPAQICKSVSRTPVACALALSLAASFTIAPTRAHAQQHAQQHAPQMNVPAVYSSLVMRDVSPSSPMSAGAPFVLRLPASARVLAMGNAGIASTDADALFYNPGMLSVARGMSVSVQTYDGAGYAGSIASVAQAGSMSFGVGAQFVSGNVAPTLAGRPDAQYLEWRLGGASALFAEEGAPVSSVALTFGVARTIKGLRLGVGATYAEDRLGALHDGTAAFDVGMVRPMGPGSVALVAQNLGAGTRIAGQDVSLPRRFGVGYGIPISPRFEHFDVGGQVQLALENDFVRTAGGVEIGYVPIEGVSFIVRTGLRRPRDRDESRFTGGLGITVDRLSVDYAAEPFRGGNPVSHRIAFRIR